MEGQLPGKGVVMDLSSVMVAVTSSVAVGHSVVGGCRHCYDGNGKRGFPQYELIHNQIATKIDARVIGIR